jgi:hypothetical protein
VRRGLRVRWPRRHGQPNAAGWLAPIRRGIASHVAVEETDIAQPPGNVVLLEAVCDGHVLRAAIDYDDQSALHACAPSVDLYFKLQYLREGYGLATVRPGGFVSRHLSLYRFAHRWRALRRRSPPSIDVLGRFGLNWAQQIRTQAIGMLREQDRFEFRGGASPVWWGAYMDEMCTARVCLDLPGRGEFCYRLVEYLAVGACVIGPELAVEMPVPLQSGVHLQRVPRSLEGLVDWCERLLADDALRSRTQEAAADYFDRYLALDQLGAYYVDCLWQAAARSASSSALRRTTRQPR